MDSTQVSGESSDPMADGSGGGGCYSVAAGGRCGMEQNIYGDRPEKFAVCRSAGIVWGAALCGFIEPAGE